MSFPVMIEVGENSRLLFDRTKFTVSYSIERSGLADLISIIF
jgi:hypothetical protein